MVFNNETIELRSCWNLDLLADVVDTPGMRFSFGSEYCHKKMLPVDRYLRAIEQLPSVERFAGWVMPPLGEEEWSWAEAFLNKAIAELPAPLDLVVSDYGLLHWAFRTYGQSLSLRLSRCLCRAITDNPWWTKILRDETEYARTSAAQLNIFHSPKVQLFKRLGVTQIELDVARPLEPGVQRLRQSGFHVRGHYPFAKKAQGRDCHTAQRPEARHGKCSDHCKRGVPLEVVGIWRGFQKSQAVPDAEQAGFLNQLVSYGNSAVTRISFEDLAGCANWLDGVVLDCDVLGDELQETFQRIAS